MCSIAGIVAKGDKSVLPKVFEMLKKTSYRGPDGVGVYFNKKVIKSEDLEGFSVDGHSSKSALGHTRLAITGKAGIQPLKSNLFGFGFVFNGEIWNYKKLKKKMGHQKFETDSDSEILLKTLENKYKGDLKEAAKETMKELDGDYCFAIMDSDKTVIARDPVGIKPLYYLSNEKEVAFCSEKKALVDFEGKIKRLLPGEISEIKSNGVKVFEGKKLKLPAEKNWSKEKSFEEYKKVLVAAVKKRVDGHEKIGILFSGGVDSTMIAAIARDLGKKVICYTSGMKDSGDYITSQTVAKKLGVPIKSVEITKEKIEETLPEIIETIEETELLQVEVAAPVFLAVEEAKKDGIRVLLTGQGADELFAGYDWYPKYLEENGKEKLRQAMWYDTKVLFKETLEREDKITMKHSIELRVPFLDPEVIDTAFKIPLKWKTFKGDKMCKNIHRELADYFEIPKEIAWRKKDAAQSGSGVHELIKEIAKEKEIERDENITDEEREYLGSFYRYKGKKYGSEIAQKFVQNIANGSYST